MSYRVDCPYCNAATVIAEQSDTAQCSRCGESFRPTAYHESTSAATTANESATPPQHTKWVLAVALLVVAGGLIAMVRNRATPLPKNAIAPVDTATVKPPATLTGLKYLGGANMVIVLQPAAIDAIARRQSQSTRELASTMGVPAEVWDTLERAGIAFDQIDHLAVGLTFAPDRLIPGVIGVLKLREAVPESAMIAKVKGQRKPQTGRAIYTTGVQSLLMTPVDDTTYLFGLTDNDFNLALGVKDNARPLNDDMQRGLGSSISPASVVALATDRRDWSDASPLLKTDAGKPYAATLARVKCVALGIAFEPEATLSAAVEFQDESIAMNMVNALTRELPTATITRDGTIVKVSSLARADTFAKLIAALKP